MSRMTRREIDPIAWASAVFEATDLSRERIATLVGISRGWTHKWMQGKRKPSEEVLAAMSKVLLLSREELPGNETIPFEQRAAIASGAHYVSAATGEASKRLARIIGSACRMHRFHVVLYRFEKFLKEVEKDLFPRISEHIVSASVTLREIVAEAYRADQLKQIQSLEARSEASQFEVSKRSLAKQAKEIQLGMKKRLTDEFLLRYFRERKVLKFADGSILPFQKSLGLDDLVSSQPRHVFEDYWHDVANLISIAADSSQQEETFRQDFFPEFQVLRRNVGSLEISFTANELHSGLRVKSAKVVKGMSDRLTEDYEKLEVDEKNGSYRWVLSVPKGSIIFFRFRAFDDHQEGHLSPIYCVDAHGSYEIYQYRGESTEMVTGRYLKHFRLQREEAKRVSPKRQGKRRVRRKS